MKSTKYTVNTTAQKIISAGPSSQRIYCHVIGNGIVYLGDAAVTSSNGTPTEKGAVPIEVFVPRGNELWAVVVSGTEDLRVLTEGA